ncbi:MAG: integral rane sensor signal transduction histidine kinase [Alphaproteobacteria bacterium]|nr:integral rane sensor signal transduction histidine kinase [Alphaproteobacteria bacterium]
MLGLAVGGLVLSNAFGMAAQNNFDATLQADMDSLIAAAEPDPHGGVTLQGRFLSHNFDRVYSGLYYQIKSGKSGGQISRSLFDKQIVPVEESRKGALTWGTADGPENQKLRVVSRRVDLTPDDAADADYTFMVAGDLSEVDRQTAEFNTTLFWSFLLLGFGLIGAILVQVKIGLLPLRRVSRALAKIRDGEARRLDGNFPTEIAPLASELNSLIQHSEEVVGRARTHVSNLAHFLKTPLSVLAAEADAEPGVLADTVKKQVFSMRRQVDHYLSRARAAGSLDVLGNRTHVSAVVDDLARVIGRIHAGIVIDAECDENFYFRGERQDLEEMLGNLIDNACKWAKTRVRVRCEKTEGRLRFRIEDDGPGLSAEQRAKVGERGERLDESVPGSGLGLAIVRDISRLYGGFFTLDASSLGGVLAYLELPAIT